MPVVLIGYERYEDVSFEVVITSTSLLIPALPKDKSHHVESIVLVTGGTGLLGSHLIAQLLATDKYIIRGTARSAQKLRDIFPNEPRLEVFEIPDWSSDHTEVLKGVQAVQHLAAPLFYNKVENGEVLFNGVYGGALHIVKQALAAGIKKITYTGTYAALFELHPANRFRADRPLNEMSFGNVRKDLNIKEVISDEESLKVLYIAAKIIGDKDTWEIAHQHPDVDVTVRPVVPNFPVISRTSLSTNDYVYQLILNGPDTYPPVSVGDLVDVRDMARAHVLALLIPGKDKRFIVSGGKYHWKEIGDLIRRERPEVAHRLSREDVKPMEQTVSPIDLTFTEKELGITEYHGWEESALAALDCGLMLEREN
ncbi:hypothetical protein D9758_017600 [Tetrapyrgos nigripes]|uniref:NAD-dependent epimerase/dehydratase domain-containing protein n=1 Tax=Tetrapyrgos nigripes TaxID=182062 RepID=A0A8H5C2U8_9AGAR|nr:hypothetical protein D9758_017600 [Tetrapyrgos nigripes]